MPRKSKNDPQNRIKHNKNYCEKCKEMKKPVFYVQGINNKMVLSCKCGLVDKQGNLCQ